MKTLIKFSKKFRPAALILIQIFRKVSENFQRFYSRTESNVPAGCKLLPDTKKAKSPGNEVLQGVHKKVNIFTRRELIRIKV